MRVNPDLTLNPIHDNIVKVVLPSQIESFKTTFQILFIQINSNQNLMKALRNFLFLAILASAFVFVGCDDDCDVTCSEGEVLSVDCECITVTSESCPGVTCPDGEVVDNSTCECIEVAVETEVRVTTNISSDVTWTADKCYILGGRITVLDGATLTIEAGTVVKGEAGTGVNSTALLVARGGKLNANGTSDAPIIFTSVADEITPTQVASGDFTSPNLDPTTRGLWGGVIILGNAPISAQNDNDIDVASLAIEGIPTSDSNGLYGGDNSADDSGTITYISIRHGGTNIGAGNEINGLTLGGVGSGTTISNVEVVGNADDGIEWFGGTVSVSNVVVWNSFDDALDTDQAWNGTCENFIVVTPRTGSAMELDGPEGTLTQGPNQFNNGVIYVGSDIDHIVDWDGSTNTGISNLYVFGIDPEYKATADLDPIESFGGDGSGTTSNWEATLPSGTTITEIFTDGSDAIVTTVSENANSVGPDASAFGWTWAGQASDGLQALGL